MVVGKAKSITDTGAYLRVENLKSASLGSALTLPANIRLGWKGLAEINALANNEK